MRKKNLSLKEIFLKWANFFLSFYLSRVLPVFVLLLHYDAVNELK